MRFHLPVASSASDKLLSTFVEYIGVPAQTIEVMKISGRNNNRFMVSPFVNYFMVFPQTVVLM